MKVSEIFYSLQGEGRLVGTPSVFIRLSGCPLRCHWCDTKYALDNSNSKELSIPQIIEQIQPFNADFVVITGGEPLISPDLLKLTQELKQLDKQITIETAGISFVDGLCCDLMSISPKLSNSTPIGSEFEQTHDKNRLNIPVIKQLIKTYNYQLKFVVDNESDFAEIEDLVKLLEIPKEKIYLMPQAKTRQQLLEKSGFVCELCKKSGFNYGQRLHVMLWDSVRGV